MILLANLIFGCRNQGSAPDAVHYSYGIRDIITSAKVDSTIESIDSCIGIDYKAELEEYIYLDSNAFKLTISKKGLKKIYQLNLSPGKTNIEKCTKDFIIFSSHCGGPCSAKDFFFVKENRLNEGYMFCNIAEKNDNIISYHEDEVFEVIKIRNLKNSKEISVDIGPCDNSISYPCGISKLKVLKDKLSIIFDSPEENPRKKEINIREILD